MKTKMPAMTVVIAEQTMMIFEQMSIVCSLDEAVGD